MSPVGGTAVIFVRITANSTTFPSLPFVNSSGMSERLNDVSVNPLYCLFIYTLKRRATLSWFLEDGELQLDNNRNERTNRLVVMGCSNWLFVGFFAAGERAAKIMSLLETAKKMALGEKGAHHIATLTEKRVPRNNPNVMSVFREKYDGIAQNEPL